MKMSPADVKPSLWKDHEFLKLWSGQTISEIGSRVTREGLPYTATALLGASPFQMGLLTATQGLVGLAAGPIAGLAADRYPRRLILLATDLGRAAALALIPLAAFRGSLDMTLLFLVAVLSGFMTIFFDTSYQAYIPRLVPDDQLLEANGKIAVSAATAEVLGPGITGFLIQIFGAPRAILLDALSFVVSAASIFWIRRPEVLQPRPHAEESLWRSAFDGIRFVRSQPVLHALALRTAMMMFSFGFFAALYMLFAVKELKLPPAVIGVVVMMGGISNLIGSFLSGHILRWFRLGPVLIAATILPGLAACLIPMAPSGSIVWGAVFLGASQLLGDVAFPIYGVHELTLRQALSPPAMLGRVNACMLMVRGLLPIGAVAGGALATWVGPRTTLWMSAAGILGSALFLLVRPVRELRDHPERIVRPSP